MRKSVLRLVSIACLILPLSSCSSASTEGSGSGPGTVEEARTPPPVTVAPDAPDPMVRSLRMAFQERNPIIEHVTLIEFRRVGTSNVVLASGLRADGRFKGAMEDELFGIFVFDDSLLNVRQAIDVFPTRRWRDYTVSIEKADAESVVVLGRGSTYGDSPLRRAYAWPAPG